MTVSRVVKITGCLSLQPLTHSKGKVMQEYSKKTVKQQTLV